MQLDHTRADTTRSRGVCLFFPSGRRYLLDNRTQIITKNAINSTRRAIDPRARPSSGRNRGSAKGSSTPPHTPSRHLDREKSLWTFSQSKNQKNYCANTYDWYTCVPRECVSSDKASFVIVSMSPRDERYTFIQHVNYYKRRDFYWNVNKFAFNCLRYCVLQMVNIRRFFYQIANTL